ncbi:hypothetical protein ACQKWADRAFT_311240 [Trichoderma austrokoningii]
MNSVFLGFLNSHDFDVSRHVVLVEAFAVLCTVWNCISFVLAVGSGEWFVSLFAIPGDAFVMGCYIFIAIAYKSAIGECKSYADTVFGDIVGVHGMPSVQNACGMQVANFSLAVTAATFSGACILMEMTNICLNCLNE